MKAGFFGSLALLAGPLTRFTAASLAVIMLGAITMVRVPHGFLMNWFGKQQGEVLRVSSVNHWNRRSIAGHRRWTVVNRP